MKTIPDITELARRPAFAALYRSDGLQRGRWERLLSTFASTFDTDHVRFFSAPGRTELGGNHTDHHNGIVLAAAVNLDSIAVAAPNATGRVTLIAEGYDDPFVVKLDDLHPRPTERGTTTALLRGIASRLGDLGHRIGGFDACVTSDVLIGSGLSSSASIEVLIGTIFNALYNDSAIDPVTIATAGQFAENNFFGKPSGLMDQIACAMGGAMMIDFQNVAEPAVTKINIDSGDYSILVVNTGGSHADLTEDYASIPREMRMVAEALGKRTAREMNRDEIVMNIRRLRSEAGDRSILRAMHFLRENERVTDQATALRSDDFEEFLRLVRQSGDSSCKWLENCYSPGASHEQGIMLALALTEDFLSYIGHGACRVHGGGFEGTIQVWLPTKAIGEYRPLMTNIFGENSVPALKVRATGAVEI